jgi:hypothetical protein
VGAALEVFSSERAGALHQLDELLAEEPGITLTALVSQQRIPPDAALGGEVLGSTRPNSCRVRSTEPITPGGGCTRRSPSGGGRPLDRVTRCSA